VRRHSTVQSYVTELFYFLGAMIAQSVLRLHYGLNGSGFVSRQERFFYLYSIIPAWLWGLPNLLFSRYRRFLPGIKRPGCNVDKAPPCSAIVCFRASTGTLTCTCISFFLCGHFPETHVCIETSMLWETSIGHFLVALSFDGLRVVTIKPRQ